MNEKKRPLIIGHMGTDAYAPRNTILSFQKAIDMGADGIELDINRAADGSIVVIHDESIDHTSNGSGRIDSMTLSQLRQYSYAYHFADRFQSVAIPLLEEVLELMRPTGMMVDIEIKGTAALYPGLELQAAALVESLGMTDRVLYTSFDSQYLLNLVRYKPQLRCGLLHNKMEDIYSFAQANGFAALATNHEVITEEHVSLCRAHGLQLFAWTIDEPERISAIAALGVDGIITNKADVALNLLR